MKEKKVPKEILEKLKGYSVVEGDFEFDVNENELGDFAPNVIIKSLTNLQEKKIEKEVSKENPNEDNLFKIIKDSIVSIENIYDLSTGDKIEVGLDELYEKIPKKLKLEIVNEIMKISGLA